MQETETIGAPSRGAIESRAFEALFAIAAPKPVDADFLSGRLGIPHGECTRLVEGLQREYLLDVVSRLQGEEVRETLRLTEAGEATLLRSLESMCELPEACAD